MCRNSGAFKDSVESVVANVNEDIKVLLEGYLETTISENVISQCKQCTYGVMLAKQIVALLKDKDGKEKQKLEKTLRKELTGNTIFMLKNSY